MVAVVSGSGLGLFGSSLNVLGGGGAQGNAGAGRGTDRVYLNAATGNLVIQSQDERLSALGLGLSLVRTYNSQGALNDDNGDNWVLGVNQRVYGLTGTVNTSGSTIRKVFGDGRDVLYTYNTTNARYESTEGDGAHDALSFNSGTSQWTWTDGSKRNTETFNNAGQILNSKDADGNTVTYAYTGALLTSVTDASGQVTTLVYSGTNLTEIRVVSNSVTQTLTRYTYDASNRLSTVRVDLSPGDNAVADGNVYTTTYTYDGTSKRVASITQSDGSAVSFTYQSINSQYRVATYTVTNATGNRTTTLTYTSYNTTGAVYLQTNVQDPLGLVTSYTHDSAGRLTSVLSPTVNGTRLETRYAYDASGNVTSITEDPTGLNRQTVLTYDANGNLLTTRDSLGNSTARTYNANNQLLTETQYLVRDPDGAGSGVPTTPITTRYVYDVENHLRFAISADGRTTEHRYNTAGQRILTLRYTGATYSAANFAESDLTTWAAAQNQTLLERVDYAYDFRGNLTTTTAWVATTSTGAGSGTASITRFVYDQRGQLLQTIEARGEATTTDANDYRTAFTYDGLGRMLTKTEWVSSTASRASVMAYDDVNRQTTTTLANGLITTSIFNQAGELISVVNGASGTLGTTTYKYDTNGRLRMITDPIGIRQFYLYDEAGRRIATVDGDGSLSEVIYNRASQPIKTIQYAALLDATTLASLVDGSGNPTNVALATLRTAAGGNAANDRISRVVYDASGAVVFAIDATGAVTELRYDGAGRVTDTFQYYNRVTIARTVDEVLPAGVTLTAHANDRRTRSFYNNDGQLLGKLDADGYLTEYVYGNSGLLTSKTQYANQTAVAVRATGTLADLKTSAGTDNETTIDPERDIVTYLLYDGQGRQVGMYDAEGYLTETVYDVAGNVAERIRYDQVLTWSATATVSTLRAQVAAATVRERTVYAYDGVDQVVTETFSRGSSTAVSSVVTSYVYDSVGNLTSTTRAASTTSSRTTEARYDFLGRVLQELTAEGRALITVGMTQVQIDDIWSRYGVAYTYDLAGRKISASVRPNDTQTNKTVYFYDNDGRVRFEVNVLGERVEYRYNALGQLIDELRYTNRIATTGLNGGLLTSTLITTLTGSVNATNDTRTTYQYTLDGRVSSVRTAKTTSTAEDGLTTFTYNAFGENDVKIESIDATRTLRHDYTYDKRGALTLTRWDNVAGGFNTSEARTYDAFGRLRTVTDARSNVVKRVEYDRFGREIASVDSSTGDRTITTYDAFSRIRTVRDALLNTTTYTYDDANRRMTMTTPEGVAIVTTFSLHDERLTVVAAGITTTYTYDKNGKLTGVSDTLGTLEGRTYDRGGRQVTQTNARGIVTTFAYDAANRVLTRTEDSAGGLSLATTYTYDGQGRVTRVQEPSGRITDTTYDRDGRVTQVALDPSGLNIRTAYTYDRQDKSVTVTEGVGSAKPRRTQYLYDTLGRRTEEVVEPTALGGTLNLRTQYRYDANGNVTRRIDANGYSIWYVYDADNRVTDTIDALGGVTRQIYDLEDRVISTRRFANTVATGSFGDIVTSISIATTANDRFTQSVYDRDGRELYSINALNGVIERTFDANGNVTRERQYANAIAAGTYTTTAAVATALTTAGNSTSTLSANDRVTWMAYDLRGQMAFSVDGLGGVTQYAYDANGNTASTVQFATLRSTSLATDLATLQSWATSNAGNTQNRTTRYWYDATDRLRFVLDAEGNLIESRFSDATRQETAIAYAAKPTIVAGATLAQVVTAAAGIANASNDQPAITLYDLAGRVLRETDALGNYDEYTYDAVGNRITYRDKRGSIWDYEYDAAGRLTKEIAPSVAVTTVSESGDTLVASASSNVRIETVMTYDALGNVRTRVEASNTSQARTTTYTYDALGRQVRTDFPAVGVYDAATGDTALGASGAVVGRTETSQVLYSEVTYDALGNAWRNRDVAGNSSYTVFDQLGRVKSEIDSDVAALRFVTSYTYDTFGNRLTVTRYNTPFGGTLPTSGSSTITPATSGADRTVTSAYDRLNRVIQVTQSSVHNYLTSAGAGGGTSLTTSPTVLTEYNAFGEAVRMRELIGSGTYADTYLYYDRRGMKTAHLDPLKQLTIFEYDETGDLKRQVEYSRPVTGTVSTSSYGTVVVTTAAGSPGNAAGYDREVRYVYDRLNRKVSETRIGIEHTSVSGSTTTTTVADQATTFGYDVLGNQTRMTTSAGNTYTYYDVLGRVVGVAEMSRDRGDGTTLTPLTLMRRDAHGNLIEQRILANGASAANESSYTASATTNADRLSLMRVDSHGRVVQTYEWLNASDATSRYASYNARGEAVKEWQRINNGSTAETIVTLYQYDALGRQTALTEPQRFNGSTPVLVTTRSAYNAFGEITSKSVDGLSGSESFEYDQAGRVWRTNSGDGVYKVYLYNLQGNATAEIKSQYNAAGSVDLSTPANAAAANGLAGTIRTETVYDILGRVVEQRAPTFTVLNPQEPIQETVAIDAYSGHAYLHFSPPLDATLTVRVYINGVERTLVNVPTGSEAGYERGVDLTALGLTTGSYTYRITYSRPTDATPIAAVEGTFAFSVTTTSTIGIVSTAGAGSISSVSTFISGGTTLVYWAHSSAITSATFEIRVGGSWQSYTAGVDEGSWGASFGTLGAGSYEYRITGYINGVIDSVGRGTLSVSGASSSTAATGLSPSAPWAAVAPISASATAVAQAGGYVAQSASAISEPIYDESNNIIGYTNYWSPNNVVNMSWLDVGYQGVNVVLYYRTATGLDTNRPAQYFGPGNYTGGQLSWYDPTQPDGSHGHGGISQVNAVAVYDASWNLIRYSGYTSSMTRLTWAAPPQSTAGAWVYYKPTGAADWTGFGSAVRSGGSFIVDLPPIANGTYDYMVTQWPDFSNESAGTEATANGQFVISGSSAYIASQSGTPSYLSGVSASGSNLYWNYTPAGGDSITVTLNNGAYNLSPVHYGSGNYYASFDGVPSGSYSYTIRYTRAGSTYLLGTGTLSLSTTTTPPSSSVTQPSNLSSIGGFADLGGGYFGWTTAPSGGTLVFKYKAAGAASWAGTLTPALSGGYYRVYLGALSGSYDYEVTYIAAGDTSAYRVGSGRLSVASNQVTSGTVSPGALPTMQATPTTTQTMDRWGNTLTQTTIIRELQPNGSIATQNNTWTYRYNQYGQLLQVTEPATAVVAVNKDSGAVSTSTAGAVSSNYYDVLGRLIATRDGNGNLNRKNYNAAGQTTSEVFADGGQKAYVFDIFGQQIQMSDQAGFRTRQQFDRAGRLTGTASEITASIFNSLAPSVTTVLGFTAAPNGVLTKQYTYDQAGRRLSETTGEVMDDGVSAETRRYTYDLLGNVTGYGGTLGASIQFRYDANGRKTFHQDGLGAQATWTYDYFGHMTGHLDFGGTTYAYNYDARTWLLKTQTSSGGTNAGQNKAYEYDAANQLTKITDTGVNVNRVTQYLYDGAGRRALQRTWIGGLLHEETRTRYDAAGRTYQISGRGFIVTYSYDLADNRTRIDAYYASSGYTLNHQDLWYRYDQMNRVTISQGINASGVVNATGASGTELTYSTRGNRTSAGTATQLFTYAYDGLGRLNTTTLQDMTWDESGQPVLGPSRLVEDRDYDRASRVTRLQSSAWEGGSWATRVTTSAYNDAGLTLTQNTTKQLNSGPIRNESALVYGTEGGYDAAGNVVAYTMTAYKADGTFYYNSSHGYTYRAGESYQEATHSVSSSGVIQNGSTSHTYNANGELIQFTDSRDQTRNRYFANNAMGNPLTVVKGNYGTNPSAAFSNAVGGSGFFSTTSAAYFFFSADGQQVGTFGQIDGASLEANFDVNYTPVSSSYPSNVPSSYVAQQGDTLRSIAAKLFGDGNLWYLIGQANGLSDPDAVIPDGRTLEIPNQVISLSNNATTFKPFDITDAIGDTTPTQPAIPPPKKKKGCGVIGQIIVIIVAIVVTYLSWGSGSGWAAGMVNWAFGAGAAATTAGAAVGMGIAAAAGSIVSQGVGIGIGVQDKFSWKSVAAAGLTAGILNGTPLGSIAGEGANLGMQVAQAAVNNAVGQGVNIALGLQKKFDWRGVVSAALAAPLANWIGDKFPGERFTTWGPGSIGHTLAHAALGAGVAAIRGQDPWAGAIGGATEALLSGFIAPGDNEFFDKTLRNGATQLAAAGVAAAFGRDPMVAANAAQNAFENNYLHHSELMQLVEAERRLRANPNDAQARATRDRLQTLDRQRNQDLATALISGDTLRFQELAGDAAFAAAQMVQEGNPYKYLRTGREGFDRQSYELFEDYGQRTISVGSLYGTLAVEGFEGTSIEQRRAWSEMANTTYDAFARFGRLDFSPLWLRGRPDSGQLRDIGMAWFYEENRLAGTLDNTRSSALAALGVAIVAARGGDAEAMYRASELGATLGGLTLVGAMALGRTARGIRQSVGAAGPGRSPSISGTGMRITLAQRGANHNVHVADIARQLRAQGYTVKGNGARFYDRNGQTYTQTDLFAIRPDGRPVVFEIKTGNGGSTNRQLQIYPQIMSGDAIPSRPVATMLGIRPGVPLSQQGYPNGIPVYQVRAPGL